METAPFPLKVRMRSRGDGGAAVQVLDVDSRREEVRRAPQRAPQAHFWITGFHRRQCIYHLVSYAKTLKNAQ